MNSVFDLNGDCTGCSACSVICPSSAIEMRKNAEGFFAPFLDNTKCVSCGLCRKACDKNVSFEATSFVQTSAFQARKKELLSESSSGGVASTLSQEFACRGGYVLGAFFDLDNNIVNTMVSKADQDLAAYRKSKYLQANYQTGLLAAVRIARSDKTAKFLVFGTPCQIAGAVNVCDFYSISDQFVFVDFFCHGVPSYYVWDYYLKDRGINPKELEYVSFRSKAHGWQSCFAMNVKAGEKRFFCPSGKDAFYNAFFDNVFLMKSCYQCKFRKGFSKADIRLGDYWGGRYSKNSEGVSSALVFSDKGLKLLSEAELEVLPSGLDLFDAQSIKDYSEIQYRDAAFQYLLESRSLGKAIKYYRKRFPMKRRVKLLGKRLVYTFLPVKIINALKGNKWKQ